MKVLMQGWNVPGGGGLVSISKNKKQIKATTDRVEAEGGGADGEPMEVEIPDDHVFTDMLENGTVFLHDDEMDVIIYPEQ